MEPAGGQLTSHSGGHPGHPAEACVIREAVRVRVGEAGRGQGRGAVGGGLGSMMPTLTVPLTLTRPGRGLSWTVQVRSLWYLVSQRHHGQLLHFGGKLFHCSFLVMSVNQFHKIYKRHFLKTV